MTHKEKPKLVEERRFIELLSKLPRGPLAELRRSLSDVPSNSAHSLERQIYAAEVGHLNRSAVYLVAGLYALIERPHDDETDEQAEKRASREGKSLGHLLGHLYREQNERPSTEKRFLALLDADEAGLPYQLRQAVALLKGSDIKPDWAQLLRDVSRWNHDEWGNDVRRRWAREFYRTALAGQPQTDSPTQAEDDLTDPTEPTDFPTPTTEANP